MGLINHVFSEDNLKKLYVSNLGIGHTRYSTSGISELENCQPFVVETLHGKIAVAHNGELINAKQLRRKLMRHGVGLSTSSDSELITQLLAFTPPLENDDTPDWVARIKNLMNETPTSYSLLMMHKDIIYAVRDPYGNRPLCIGRLISVGSMSGKGKKNSETEGWVVSSESCSFLSIGAQYYREVLPGEIVKISRYDVQTLDVVPRPGGDPSAFCIFEYVYFARPDSIFEGQMVYSVRRRCGQQLAVEAPVEADLVSTVPESATPAALGYAQKCGLPYVEVLCKNRYVGRTFIQPNMRLRQLGVAKKFGVLSDNFKGKRIVLIDDSIVRGNTISPIIKLLRESGAKEVHIRVASPPIKFPCYMGINIPTKEELIANRPEFHDLAKYIGTEDYAPKMTLQEMVHQAASLYSDRKAVCFDECNKPPVFYTYKEVVSLATELTVFLQHYCDHRGTFEIGLYCYPGINLPSWILGILQVPAAYSPLDPDAPPVLSTYFMKKCNLQYILVENDKINKFKISHAGWFYESSFAIDHVGLTLFQINWNDVDVNMLLDGAEDKNGISKATSNWETDYVADLDQLKAKTSQRGYMDVRQQHSLAYILHTSGTTGIPKIVRVPHKCIVPNILHLQSLFKITPDDMLFMASPLTFDPSVVELFVSLISGASLLIVPNPIKMMPLKLSAALFHRHRVTVLQPSQGTVVSQIGWKDPANAYTGILFAQPLSSLLLTADASLIGWGGKERVCFLDDEVIVPLNTMRETGDFVRVKDAEMFFLGRKDSQIKRHGKRLNIECVQQCLGESHEAEKCRICKSFRPRTKKERDFCLRQLLMEAALSPQPPVVRQDPMPSTSVCSALASATGMVLRSDSDRELRH
ncbi:Amidophosphoribosyltransferase [Chelonia mydas]|uniref:Amidophosphoribosyltransferase n=1 Tax=Chelonia mydas TaxID=8469 RepID=M7AZ82_CHEMY|nr:Amidophosphoribosyltransferase [Chelonia mydas]